MHFEHLSGCSQLDEPCPKRWEAKQWAGPTLLNASTINIIQNRSEMSNISLARSPRENVTRQIHIGLESEPKRFTSLICKLRTDSSV